MITEFNKYNLITEDIMLNTNDDVKNYAQGRGIELPILFVGDEIKYIENCIIDPGDMLMGIQLNYAHTHKDDIQTINKKFYGSQWWSMLNVENDNSWFPDKYLMVVKPPIPTYMLSPEERKNRFIK